MRLKMKNVKIMGVHQFLGEGEGHKNIMQRNSIKIGGGMGLDNLQGGLAKNREEGVFEGAVDTSMHTMIKFQYIPELEIGLADVSA